MSWSIGYDSKNKRDIGYGVPAICDHPDCNKEINRGLSYVCGEQPYGGEYGCGLFFCDDHKQTAGLKRDFVSLCKCCYTGKGQFTPKPDTKEWNEWKLADESWQQWRDENPAEVERLKLAISNHSPSSN